MANETFDLDVGEARAKIGRLWGLDRDLTKAELARALRLSPTNGGDFIGKLERGTASLSGPVYGLIEALMRKYKPPHMSDIIKPGYPRGDVR